MSNIGLEGTAYYAGLIIALAEGLGQGFFGPLGKKRAFYAILVFCKGYFLVFSSNLSNF